MATPIEMPIPLPVRSKTFDLLPQQLQTSIPSGFIQTLDRTKPYWVAEYTTPPLRDERYQAMQAFIDSLEGAQNSFVGYDPRRPVPYAYRALPIGSAPWVTAQVNSSSNASSVLNITFGAATVITSGDYMCFYVGNQLYLFRARETKAAGTSISLKVSPRPPDLTGPYTLRLIRAGAAMKLVPGSVKWTDSVDSAPVLTFQAVQFKDRAT